jgi:hypothetical protein
LSEPEVPEPLEVKAYYFRGRLYLIFHSFASRPTWFQAKRLDRTRSGEAIFSLVTIQGLESWGNGWTWGRAKRALMGALLRTHRVHSRRARLVNPTAQGNGSHSHPRRFE